MVETKKDLTGMTFGRLTVIGRAEDYVHQKDIEKHNGIVNVVVKNIK